MRQSGMLLEQRVHSDNQRSNSKADCVNAVCNTGFHLVDFGSHQQHVFLAREIIIYLRHDPYERFRFFFRKACCCENLFCL